MSGAQALMVLGAQSSIGELHCPEHHAGSGEVEMASGQDAEDFSTVQGEVARGRGHTKPRDARKATGAGLVVEPGLGVEVVTAAGAAANRCAPAMAAVGQDVTAGADNQGHSIRVGQLVEWLERKVVRDVTKVT